jgi:hypothetical protein
MAKIIAPNKNYTGLSAGVMFVNGIGECTDPHLISWFKEKGYRVEENTELDEMTVKELKEYAETNEIDLGNATKKADILAKILETEEEPEKEGD